MTKTERKFERKNRFNGESVMLTKEEAIKHDQIFMAEMEQSKTSWVKACLSIGKQCVKT